MAGGVVVLGSMVTYGYFAFLLILVLVFKLFWIGSLESVWIWQILVIIDLGRSSWKEYFIHCITCYRRYISLLLLFWQITGMTLHVEKRNINWIHKVVFNLTTDITNGFVSFWRLWLMKLESCFDGIGRSQKVTCIGKGTPVQPSWLHELYWFTWDSYVLVSSPI